MPTHWGEKVPSDARFRHPLYIIVRRNSSCYSPINSSEFVATLARRIDDDDDDFFDLLSSLGSSSWQICREFRDRVSTLAMIDWFVRGSVHASVNGTSRGSCFPGRRKVLEFPPIGKRIDRVTFYLDEYIFFLIGYKSLINISSNSI
ncbi:hypothetical protein CAJAP_02417 [Camponotus japonicus]